MLHIDRNQQTLTPLPSPKLAEIGMQERQHLQALIRENPEVFFDELDETLILVGEEVKPSDTVDNRIDLLAIDRTGRTVVLELKRGNDKYQLLQSLGYAAMIADWTDQDLAQQAARFWQVDLEDAVSRLEDFLETSPQDLNEEQRTILLAEGFDFEVLATASWLTDVYGLDIRCFRVALAQHNDDELLQCVRVFPARTLSEQAVLRRRAARASGVVPDSDGTAPGPGSWPQLLNGVKNPDVRAFFEQELAANRTAYLNDRSVAFRAGSRCRWYVKARKDQAYVWQEGRFIDDVNFWEEHLPEECQVRPVQGGEALRFYLHNTTAFEAFRAAVANDGAQCAFLSTHQLEQLMQAEDAETTEGSGSESSEKSDQDSDQWTLDSTP